MSDSECPDAPEGGKARAELRVIYELVRRGLETLDVAGQLFEQAECLLLAKLEQHTLDTLSFDHPGPRLLMTPDAAYRLKITPNPDGSSMIGIDDVKPFRLSRGLTAFLKRLAADDGETEDALVAWKPRAALREWFAEQTVNPVAPSYVNNRVEVLRRCLRMAGLKRELVHTDDVKGVRFALRRTPRD
ncbi:MAG: hypothetical protein WBS19_19440 [Candidatus Korobacteraceae bacterium]